MDSQEESLHSRSSVRTTFAENPSSLKMNTHAIGGFRVDSGVGYEVVKKEGVTFFSKNRFDLAGKFCSLFCFIK